MYGAVIRSTVCRIPAIAASGIAGGASPRYGNNGAPSISDHTTASSAHSVGMLVSGGQAKSRMRIQDQPQQRRTRPAHAQHEHRIRRPPGIAATIARAIHCHRIRLPRRDPSH
jgi:hypothetical protein